MHCHEYETGLKVAHFLPVFEVLGLFHQLLSYDIIRKPHHEVRR